VSNLVVGCRGGYVLKKSMLSRLPWGQWACRWPSSWLDSTNPSAYHWFRYCREGKSIGIAVMAIASWILLSSDGMRSTLNVSSWPDPKLVAPTSVLILFRGFYSIDWSILFICFWRGLLSNRLYSFIEFNGENWYTSSESILVQTFEITSMPQLKLLR